MCDVEIYSTSFFTVYSQLRLFPIGTVSVADCLASFRFLPGFSNASKAKRQVCTT